MSRRFTFAVPGDLATPTGGYAYDRRVVAELPAFGWHADVLDLGSNFPNPSAQTRERARVLLAGTPQGQPLVIDGLALGVLPDVATLRRTHLLVGLVHHPLALETGLSASAAAALRESEREALANVRHVIVTSANTKRLLIADYHVPQDRVTVAPPGVDQVAQQRNETDGPLRLLAVGSIVPRKGYDVLIQALARLADLPWHLTIVGDASRSRETAARLNADITTAGLNDRVGMVGAVPAESLSGFYAHADVFVLASRFEGYGMAFTEAIAAGLPVIGTTAGAIPQAVPAEAGILVPPDDVDAFAAALRTVISDPEMRRRLSDGARAATASLPTWQTTAQRFARVLESVA